MCAHCICLAAVLPASSSSGKRGKREKGTMGKAKIWLGITLAARCASSS
jgi:hypothetical protein